jgi:hypothetical protein
MYYEFEKLWKEVVMACFEVLFQNLFGRTEEILRNPLPEWLLSHRRLKLGVTLVQVKNITP